MTDVTEGRAGTVLLRWMLSLAILCALAWWVDPGRIIAEVSSVSPWPLAAALAITVVQTMVSAWRWRFTSARLGLTLSWRRAVGDYYLASFVNQVLPGGIAGDAWRAHRHARRSDSAGSAWRAVVIERASGQAVVFLATLSVLALVPTWREILAPGLLQLGDAWIWPLLAAALSGLMVTAAVRRWPDQWCVLRREVYAALLSRAAWPRQLAASSVVVFSYALVFALAARGLGVDASFGLLLAVALPVLLSMLIPLSVAGWGVREAAAASVWLALGLPAEQGVVVAIAYGLVALVGALPGGVVLVLRPRG